MKANIIHLVVLVAFVMLGACHFNVKIEQEAEKSNIENTAVEFVKAYNAHDSNKMLSMVHDNIKYMYIDNETIYTETNNKTELAQFLINYFQQKPTAHSEVVSSFQNNRFIHQVEKAIWEEKGNEQKAQCSLSVYEVSKGLIVNVWYHQAYECPVSDN